MKRPIVMVCALLGLVGYATAAGAYPIGGGGSSLSIHRSMSSALGDARRDSFKRPIDADSSGQSEPAPHKAIKMAPKTKGQGTRSAACKAGRARCP